MSPEDKKIIRKIILALHDTGSWLSCIDFCPEQTEHAWKMISESEKKIKQYIKQLSGSATKLHKKLLKKTSVADMLTCWGSLSDEFEKIEKQFE
jgi:hypothetical protein